MRLSEIIRLFLQKIQDVPLMRTGARMIVYYFGQALAKLLAIAEFHRLRRQRSRSQSDASYMFAGCTVLLLLRVIWPIQTS